MSLFSTLNVANKALYASQIGMDVTAQNISNAGVAGYSRKRVDLTAAYQRHTTFGQFGFGVDVVSISRIRSEYIDSQIRRQSHELGKHQAINFVLESMENIFREPSDTGILEYMNKFFNSWENLANNPADLAARNALRTNAAMLADVFRNVTTELDSLKATRNQEMISIVNKVNNIAMEIFSLNGEISLVQLQGQSANDSKDRRDQLMRELSELIDFEVQFAHDGQVTISVSGNILVSPASMNRLEIYEDMSTRMNNPTGNFNQFGVRMEKGKNQIIPRGGQLSGLMIARDQTIPAFEAQLDELARMLVTTVNNQHRLGYNLLGFTGFDFFDPTGLTARDIRVSAAVQHDVNNIAAARGGTLQNIRPSNVFIELDNDVFFALNPITGGYERKTVQLLRSYPPPADGSPGDPARNIASGSVILRVAGTNTTLVEGLHFVVNYNFGTIQMIDDTYANEDFEINFQFSTGGFPGVGNNENADAIAKLRTQLTMREGVWGAPTATFDQFYGSMIAELGLSRREAMANIDTREYLIGQYDTQQDSIAGVSLDEEMSNLIRYQYTYQAAARIFSTAQTMLDILMNL